MLAISVEVSQHSVAGDTTTTFTSYDCYLRSLSIVFYLIYFTSYLKPLQLISELFQVSHSVYCSSYLRSLSIVLQLIPAVSSLSQSIVFQLSHTVWCSSCLISQYSAAVDTSCLKSLNQYSAAVDTSCLKSLTHYSVPVISNLSVQCCS